MYGYFTRYLGPFWGTLACALWFVALIIGILLCSGETQAPFAYMGR